MRGMCNYLCMETTSTQTWEPKTDTFAARLALLRHHMQWNLKEASVECGFTINQWAQWEAGRNPRGYMEVCEKISKRTNVDMVWLAMGAETGKRDYQALVSPSRARRSPSNRQDTRHPAGKR